MKKSTPAPLASVRTRRFIWGTLIFCAANYLAHLFPISLMSTFGWQTDVLHDQNPSLSSARFNQVVAWFEFFIVSFIILVLVEILAVLLVFREGLRLCFGGRDELSIDGSGYLLLFFGPLLAGSLPMMLLVGGPEAFVGTRAAGMGIHMLMFVTAFLTACTAAYNVGYSLEPEAMHKTTV